MPGSDSSPKSDPIMVARFAVPMPPSMFVRRKRLEERLEEGIESPLVLVNGPPGAGKTSLLAQWFHTRHGSESVAWLTVEPSDNVPGVFWAYVLEALRHHGVELPEGMRAPAEDEQVDPVLLGRLAAHMYDGGRPVILVLDEFERITCPEITDALRELLRHAGGRLRLVLASRTEPLLPLHRYRAAGELTCLRAADLAFTPEEAAELFDAHGLDVSAASISALNERMDGWAAGLRLAALAAQETPDAELCLREFEAAQSTVADFLTNEVFEVQPPETQDLLLRTCILNEVHPDLADALTGRHDGARILARLHRANAFLTPIGRGWYRHHPLFAEILRIRLRSDRPGLERRLHGDAARWLGAHRQVVAALPHAAAAGDWSFAAALLVRSLAIGRLLAGRDAERLARLFAAMPAQDPGAAPELVRAALALTRHDPDRAAGHLDAARKAAPDDGGPESAALSYAGACLSVLAARLRGSADQAQDAADEAAELRARLPQALLDAHPELPAHLMGDLGATLLWHGRFTEASEALAAAARAPEAPGTAQLRHESLGELGLIDLLDGRLARAEAHARAATAEAESAGLPPGTGTGVGRLVLAEVAIDRAELDAADAQLLRAETAVEDRPDPMLARALLVARSRLLVARGEPEAALDTLRRAGQPAAAARSPWLADRAAATAATAHLAAGEPEAAIAAIGAADARSPEPAVASAWARLALGEPESALRDLDRLGPRAAHPSVVYVQALLARAQAIDALGDPVAARRLVHRALSAADGERLRLPFRLASPWLRRTLRADPDLTRPHPWLPADLRPQRAVPAIPREVPPPPIEPLSEREREVLARAAQLMSTQEIAADLYVSVNTVKTHLKNINRKLASTRRGEAVRRARRLDLL